MTTLKTFFSFLMILPLLTISGCNTDIKEIDRMNYATALGVDFKDGHYLGYMQFLEVASVAKTNEGNKRETQVYVSTGTGKSFEEAFFQIYRTAQERIVWSHVTAIIISESALKQGISTIFESISRYYEFRFTPWVYGTRGPVGNLLGARGIHGQSPLSTILHEPLGIHSQTSLVQPVRLHEFIRGSTEPGYTICIPFLALNKEQVKDMTALREEGLLQVEGGMFLKGGAYVSHLPLQKLKGLRWIQPKTLRAATSVPKTQKPSVELVIENPTSHFTLAKKEDQPQLDLFIKGKGYLTNITDESLVRLPDLTQASEKTIKDEIMEVYQNGRKQNIDILNLEHELYRKNVALWRSLTSANRNPLNEISLHDIKVSVNIIHTGTSKNERITSLP